jgi:hypothetical protein
MRRVKTQQPRGLAGQAAASSNEVRIKMTMKYSTVRYSIPGIVVPTTAAELDIINAWWEGVERNQVRDSNIVCLSNDSDAYDIHVEEGSLEELEE